MKLYLLRHGQAHDLGERGALRDEDRRLTPAGADTTRAVLRAFRSLCHPAAIWSSPLSRAWETAAIACAELGLGGQPAILDCLKPADDPRLAADWLRERQGEDLMLVGHQPHLGLLAAQLVFGRPVAGIVLKKSGLCRIGFEGVIEPGAGRLEWLAPPPLAGS